MKSFFASIIILSSVVFCTLQAQELTVATYNLRNANPGNGDIASGNGWKQRYPVITEMILFHNFDIFGTQEALHGQLEDLKSSLPSYDYIGVGRDDGKEAGEYSAIFYKINQFQLLKKGDFWMSTITDRPNKGWDAALPRICSWGYFKEISTGFKFWFFNLHMDHIGVEARKEASKLILSKINEMTKNEQVILTGDFNVDQNNESYTLLNTSGVLKDAYEMATVRYASNGTFNNFNINMKTDSRIDHIFLTKGFKVSRYGILTDIYWMQDPKTGENIPRLPSDHYPVAVHIKY